MSAIALGGNLGHSRAIFEAAIDHLNHTRGVRVITHSRWYRTAPIGPPQPEYLNGCALLSVQISPTELLKVLLSIEKQFGRIRRELWGSRTLDLDLLLFDDLILDTPTLQIPHPRMGNRAFVLVPLAEIAPDWIEPVSGQTISQLVKAVDCSGVRLSTEEYPEKYPEQEYLEQQYSEQSTVHS
ncbi:MAG: 2-amino-4-hydroxy-6-hydroxymethyldihydropteridine diphosphokinase [Merismopedia sp. SIO2A8]|nr:2-amino-4-hydroxy-6-hydroxymethyldihydropteridine diphosphokinase [Merismopedia sp. SIO2A8]